MVVVRGNAGRLLMLVGVVVPVNLGVLLLVLFLLLLLALLDLLLDGLGVMDGYLAGGGILTLPPDVLVLLLGGLGHPLGDLLLVDLGLLNDRVVVVRVLKLLLPLLLKVIASRGGGGLILPSRSVNGVGTERLLLLLLLLLQLPVPLGLGSFLGTKRGGREEGSALDGVGIRVVRGGRGVLGRHLSREVGRAGGGVGRSGGSGESEGATAGEEGEGEGTAQLVVGVAAGGSAGEREEGEGERGEEVGRK